MRTSLCKGVRRRITGWRSVMFWCTLALLHALVWLPLQVYAQKPASDARTQREVARRVPVTLVLSDTLPRGTSGAVILRRTRVTPRDIILLARETASGDWLSAAVFTLVAARDVGGDTATTDAMIRVLATAGSPAWRTKETPHAARIVSRLRQASARPIDGVGVMPAYQVYLKAKALRGQLKRQEIARD